ncbi:hypothetical protein ACGFIV_00750 [Sphaerisporangium sp. NPDC049003]|uniref:hypothetical protein n=1 Tax=Sphaerisporangium sp. NPDC049003 TaxID=3364517 RepID=UPI0037230052
MPSTECRGGHWSVVYLKPDGKKKRVSRNARGEKFADEEEARNFGLDAEADIRRGRWKDPDASITFGEWSGTWFDGLALEPTTMRNYRSMLENHLLPVFQERRLDSFTPEEMDPWERGMVRAGYAPRTAQDVRRLLGTILADAVPRHIPSNPAARKRGKGRKAVRRVEAHLRAAKQWPTPLEVILLAERAALLAGDMDVFVLTVAKAYLGARWSEILALGPESLLDGGARLNINTKLYELAGFYRGWPKDGSIREADVPPFLQALLCELAERARTCSCTGRAEHLPKVDGAELVEWCAGRRYLFLTPGRKGRAGGAHYQRGVFSSGVMRPAADGVYPAKNEKRWPRPPRPVIVDVTPDETGTSTFPGRPLLPAWPYAVAGQDFVIPRKRGQWGYDPADPDRRHIATWLPLRPGLTWHGLRHGLQTWMDDGGVKKALKVDRMGHQDNTMQGRYAHITSDMVAELLALLQGLWEMGLKLRHEIHPRSQVPVLDAALAPWREGTNVIMIPQSFPKQRNGRLSG